MPIYSDQDCRLHYTEKKVRKKVRKIGARYTAKQSWKLVVCNHFEVYSDRLLKFENIDVTLLHRVGGVKVSIVAFQAIDPGSIPG